MAIPHAASGELIDIRPLGERLAQAMSTTLIRAEHLEVLRLVLPEGKTAAEHKVRGSITIQCLEGSLDFKAHGRSQILRAGDLVYLADSVPHAVTAREHSSLLVTMLLRRV
jgi:quercetin dioxygenase-like cupin family protein